MVGVGFRPYGPGGHWGTQTTAGHFETDWAWGWAPFHYGRWSLDPVYGWVWIPGNVWAPAWVTWRYGGGYVGWAPLPPAGAAIVVESYHPYWCFVETRYLVVRDVYHYATPVQNYHVAFNTTVTVQQTMNYGGARWNSGPPAGQVSRDVGHPIHTASITPPPPGAVQAHGISRGTQGSHPDAQAGHAPGEHAAHGEEAETEGHAKRSAHGEGARERESERGGEGHAGEHPRVAGPERGHASAPPPPPLGKRRRR